MSERAPYSRVYWTIRQDERLASIYPDDHLLATWLRLLIAADMAWPAPADIPRSVSAKSLEALKAAGVIEVTGGLFTFHGLDSERGRRADAARASSAARTGSERDPNGKRTGPERPPSLAEPSQDKPSLDTGADPADTYWKLAGRYPSERVRTWLDQLSAEYGSESVASTLAVVWTTGPKNEAIGRCIDALKSRERAEERRKPKVGLRPGTAEYEMAQYLASLEEAKA